MADLTTAAVSSSLRVGLNVVSNYKKPVLEVYHQVCNQFGPEQEFETSRGFEGFKTRFQNIFIQFTLVNIGSIRAENVEMNISGTLQRRPPRESFGDFFEKTIPQFAPGQSHFLFSFDQYDLLKYPEGGGHPIGMKDDFFTITITYDAPRGFLNWFLALPTKLRGKKRFTTCYTFFPYCVAGDLPPAEYVG